MFYLQTFPLLYHHTYTFSPFLLMCYNIRAELGGIQVLIIIGIFKQI